MPQLPKSNPLLLLLLNFLFSFCVLILASHTYRTYKTQHASNPWWLPVWRAHFDTSGLVASISCSCVLILTSLTSCLLAIRGVKTKMLALCSLGLAVAGFTAALVELVVPAVANGRDAARSDTVQTWTCRWKDFSGAPEDFGGLCAMSRFTTYAPIPILVSSVLLLGKTIQEYLVLRKEKRFGDEGEEELVGITKSVERFGVKHEDGTRDLESRGT